MEKLSSISGTTAAYCCVKANPLPTPRPRLYFFVSSDSTVAASDLAAECRRISEIASAMKVHHVKAIFDATVSQSQPVKVKQSQATELKAMATADEEAKYSLYFAQALKKAHACQKLSHDVKVPAREKRPSQCHDGLQRLSPWIRSQVDVYSLMLTQKIAESQEPQKAYGIADVSQTVNRGSVFINGATPTLTTSTLLYDFGKKQLVPPASLFNLHGWVGANLDVAGLTRPELTGLVGRGMTTTALTVSLMPVLCKLGYLKQLPKSEES